MTIPCVLGFRAMDDGFLFSISILFGTKVGTDGDKVVGVLDYDAYRV